MDTWAMIAAERIETADFLGSLTPEQWNAQSLCAGWRVREVVAHLVAPFRVSLPRVFVEAIRRRGIDPALDAFAKKFGTEDPVKLCAELRANAGHRFKPPGLPPEAPLTDLVIHGLDMRVPLGLPTDRPADVVNTALAFLTSKSATKGFVAKGRVNGLRFVATDTGWAIGAGPEVTGPGWAIALALSGRGAGLDRLDGSGLAVLRGRLG